MAVRPARPLTVAGAALVTLVVAGGCGAGSPRDCTEASPARICLSRSPARLTATGLEPGSPVVISLEGPKVDAGPRPAPLTAGGDGRFPPPGASAGLVVPTGTGPVTVTVTATPRAGVATTVTFRRGRGAGA